MKNLKNIEVADNRPFIIKASVQGRSIKDFLPPKTLGRPKGELAMDSQIKNILSPFKNDLLLSGSMFVGYALLANVSQEALIRAGVETVADEMTRKFVEWTYDDDDGKNSHEKELNELETEAVKYDIKGKFREASITDGFFGGCLAYIDVGELDDEEKLEPLVLDSKTFKKGSFRGLKIIEPINVYAGDYGTADPTSDDYFNPEYWYVLGKKYHKSRFLYFAGNPVSVLLKPSYNFFGISKAQLALDYVAQFVANRESAQELLNKFSLTCWKTDMSQVLQGQSSNDLIKRVKAFNALKHNSGTMVLDKETEDMIQLNTPLTGVRDIVEMSLNLLTAVWRIPKIKYIGEGQGGLNASSKEQMHSFYDFIQSQKEKMFTQPLETVMKILQLNIGKEPNEAISFRYPALWEMDELDRADLNEKKARTAIQYITNGVLSQEEVRENLSLDKNSGYSMIDVSDLPKEEKPTEEIEENINDEDFFYYKNGKLLKFDDKPRATKEYINKLNETTESLTDKEKELLSEYANNELNDLINVNLERDFEVKEVALLDNVIAKNSLEYDIAVIHKMKELPKEYGYTLSDFNNMQEAADKINNLWNKDFRKKKFLSTSIGNPSDVANETFGNIRMDFIAKKGMSGLYIESLSNRKNEKELLLPRGLRFECNHAWVDKKNNNLVLNCEIKE